MLEGFGVILCFILFAFAFVGINLFLSRLLRPSRPSPEKAMPYECGEDPVGDAWIRFNPRFYMVALVFVVFEVELAVILPVTVCLKSWAAAGHGALAFWELMIFVGILALGLVYAWRKGDLDWVRPQPRFSAGTPAKPVQRENR